MQLLLYVVLNVLLINAISITTKYYEKLINQRTSNAETYQLPKCNEEFRSGIESDAIRNYGSYDFIIIGAGSAGSVLATRLSEISSFKILLLEAGGEEDDFNQILGILQYLQFSEKNWGYYTTKQTKSCLGLVDQKCNIPRGKSIGGSSAINGMMYVRGNRHDYDKWAELGNKGWSYDDVLPYFIKSENSQINGDKGSHGKGGLWNVAYSLPPSELLQNFIKANLEVNVSNVDYNGNCPFGAGELQFNIKKGRRQSTGTAFLNYARARNNLKVVTKALVTNLIIDPKTNTANAVEFVTATQKFQATAKKEIIVSAGVINSPQLLMLSGIGPREHLEELGIKVVADLPVGKNLIEHPMFPSLVFRTNHISPTLNLTELIELYLKGLGPLTKGAGANGVGFIHSGNGTQKVPTIEYLFVPPSGRNAAPIVGRAYNYNDTLINNFIKKVNPATDINVILALLHMKSRGRITLKSSNPIDFPNIDLNMLDKQEDVDTIIEGIEFVLKLFETKPFKDINATLLDFPICKNLKKNSNKKFWECIVRHMTVTIYHVCGSTRMGINNKTSVVDTNLTVHGIKRLRVVDAGVFPASISGHTNAPTIMMAEKISDDIKTQYGFKTKP